MNSRQRGAAFLFALLLAGRALDCLDLPWEFRDETPRQAAPASGLHSPGASEDSARGRGFPAAAAPETAETAPSSSAPVILNVATAKQLQALPGIGPVLAARIVSFRTEHGAFKDMAALRQVKGVGPRMAERLAPLLRFD